MATKLLAILNYFNGNPTYKITKVWVKYDDDPATSAFARTLRDAPALPNGDRPEDIIRPESSHDRHFHINIAPKVRDPF